MKKTWTLWITDAILFVGFLISFLLDLTGLPLHQWLGIAVGALAMYHLLLHWAWVKSVALRFFTRTSGQAKVYLLVDAGVMLGFLLILVTGLVISTWLELPLDNYPAWKNLHVAVAIATLLWVVLKIALHWRWVVTVAHRHVFVARTGNVRPAQPAPDKSAMGRREFLKLMGIVGAAAVLAIGTALDGLSTAPAKQITAEGADAESLIQGSAQSSPTPGSSTDSAASSPCVVRCSRGCSYPGRCRRYTDANGNGRCDMGECL